MTTRERFGIFRLPPKGKIRWVISQPRWGEFELRYGLPELIWVARIARPVALYDASVSAQTFEDVKSALRNAIAFEEAGEEYISRAG